MLRCADCKIPVVFTERTFNRRCNDCTRNLYFAKLRTLTNKKCVRYPSCHFSSKRVPRWVKAGDLSYYFVPSGKMKINHSYCRFCYAEEKLPAQQSSSLSPETKELSLRVRVLEEKMRAVLIRLGDIHDFVSSSSPSRKRYRPPSSDSPPQKRRRMSPPPSPSPSPRPPLDSDQIKKLIDGLDDLLDRRK